RTPKTMPRLPKKPAPDRPPETSAKGDDLESLLFLAETGGDVPEADLHGLRRDEALGAAEALVQRAFVRGERAVRLVHGKGEGRLRDALHRWLKEHPLVAGFRDAPGGGATLAALHQR
ncbi:MAG TPA: Smr/MutS family protein, partial [Candidatus Baltobacteraceae bacterium]|nr:Smr/MutS family protein [Candidatus Baltobacteraceae bacterium]